MAYQPKSYKKFVATAATATLVATAVVPAAFANEAETAAFTDVPKSYEAAIDFVVSNNISKGLTETKYGIDAQIKRGDVAIIIANAAGLNNKDAKASGFKDVPTRGTLAVNSLKEAGIVDGKSTTNFGFADSITRGEAAIMIQRAFKITGDVKDVKFTDVSDRYDDAVAALLAYKVTQGVSTTKFGTQDPIKRGDFAKFIYALKDLVVLPTNEPAVSSVSATNAKQLVVNFTTPVTAASVLTSPTATTSTVKSGVVTLSRTSTTAHTGTDVSLGDENAVLSADGKTLTITAAGSEFFEGNYDVTIKGAVSGSTTLPSVIKSVSVNDTTAPTVTGITYNTTTDKFEVTLSEPVVSDAGEVVRVNGQPVVNGFDAPSAPTNKLTFARPADVAVGSNATVYVAGISDVAGNLLTANTSTVSVTKDTTALSVSSVQQVSNQVARLTFNKVLNSTSKTAFENETGIVVTRPNGSTTSNISVSQNLTVDPTGKTYDITFADASYTASNSEVFTLTLVKDAFTDVSGNKNNLYTQTLTLTKDTVAPTVTSATLSSNGEVIEVTLSEDIAAAPTAPALKLRKDGAELTGVTATFKTGTKNVLLVDTTDTTALDGAKLAKGSYQVRLESEAVTDLNGVKNTAINAPVVNVAATPASALDAVIANSGTANVFTVTAPSGQTFTTASLASSNFRIDGQPVSSNSDITLNPARNVITVALPQEDSVAITGPAVFTTNGLALESGSALNNASATVAVVDNTAPVLTGAQLVSANVIKFTFNENLGNITLTSAAELVDDLLISNGTVSYNAGLSADGTTDVTPDVLTTSVDGKSLVVTVSPDTTTSNWSAVTSASTVTVRTLDTADTIADTNSVFIKDGVQVNLTK